MITKLIMKLPVVKKLLAERDSLRKQEQDLLNQIERRETQIEKEREGVRITMTRERAALCAEQIKLIRAETDVKLAEQREADALVKLKGLKVLRNVAWPKPAQRLASSSVRNAFDVGNDDPFWQALHQELDDAIADALDEVTQEPSAQLTTERRTHVAGGAEFLRKFQKRLLDLRHTANVDEDLEEDGKEKG